MTGHGPVAPSICCAERFIVRTRPCASSTTTPWGSSEMTSWVIASWLRRSAPRWRASASCAASLTARRLISAAVTKHAPLTSAAGTRLAVSIGASPSARQIDSPRISSVAVAAKKAAISGVASTAAPPTAATSSTPMPLPGPPAACISRVSSARSVMT